MRAQSPSPLPRQSPAAIAAPVPSQGAARPALGAPASAPTPPTPQALPVGANPAPAARLLATAPVPQLPPHRASAETVHVAEPALDRDALVDEVIERLRREARLDRERLGIVLEDLI